MMIIDDQIEENVEDWRPTEEIHNHPSFLDAKRG
jgi:hypothetical protein